jgi:hypothetical protein
MINVKTRFTSFKIGAAFGVSKQLKERNSFVIYIFGKFTLTLFDLDIHYVQRLFH